MKDKICSIFNSKFFIQYLLVYCAIAFLFNIFFKYTIPMAYTISVTFFSTIYSFFGLLSLVFFKDTKNSIIMVLFFILFHVTLQNDDINIYFAYTPAVILLIGGIIHHFIYKTRFKFSVLMVSGIIFWVAIIFSGIGATPVEKCMADYKFYYTLFNLFLSLLIIYVMLLLYSDYEGKFIDLLTTFTYIGLLILYEVLVFMLVNYFFGKVDYLYDKILQLGWGNSNTVAIMVLMIIPAPTYLYTKSSGKLRIFYGICVYLNLLTIVLTFSRVGLLISIVLFIACLIYMLMYSPKKLTLILFGIFSSLAVLVLLVFLILKPEKFEDFFEMITHFRFKDLNGRQVFYDSFLEVYDKNRILGVGLVGSFKFVPDPEYSYNFCHSSIFEMMLVAGNFGLVCLLLHWILKYGQIIMNMNKERFILLLIFLAPGLYGLVDVTYFAPVYMVFLFITYIMVNDILIEKREII